MHDRSIVCGCHIAIDGVGVLIEVLPEMGIDEMLNASSRQRFEKTRLAAERTETAPLKNGLPSC